MNISTVFTFVIKRVRPNYAPDPSVPPRVVMGWFLRKGFLPLIRGQFFRLRCGAAGFPFFLGRAVSVSYASKIHVGKSVSIGANSTINAFSRHGILIGDGSTIRENAWIQCSSSPNNPGDGLTIGSNTYLGPGAIVGVGGPVIIGSDCQIGAGFTVVAENHEVEESGASHSKVSRKGISIGSGSWIGHRVTIVDGVTLGAGCIVGAGTVVTKSFPAQSTIVGVPGRAMGAQALFPEPESPVGG